MLLLCRFDNSGHRLSFPGWQSNQTDIARTNKIIQLIANEFGPQYETVAAIEPMNESVADLPLRPYAVRLTQTMTGLQDILDQLCSILCATITWSHTRTSERRQQTRWN